MNRHGSFDDKDDASDADETSGVTSLAPVPVKTTRLNGFDFDRTHFFDVSTLLERGKAIAARAQASEHARAEATAPSAEQPLPALPVRPSIWRQFREASLARQASAIMLPLLIGLLLVKPVFKKPEPPSAGQPVPSALSAVHTPNVLAPAPEPEPEPVLAPTAAEPPPSLPRGVTLEKAAVDAVAGGDFGRALTLYRELAGRSPNNAAYHQAVVVLERRQRAPAP
jgi:hypothetical protein